MNVETQRLKANESASDNLRRSSRRPVILVTALVAGAAVSLFFVLRSPAAPAAITAVPTVFVASPLSRPVDEWDSFVGRFEPSRTVELRPRVTGQIASVNFVDGAVVKSGQILFTIDRRPFAAALDEAQGGLAGARSDLALARADMERATKLVGEDAISKSEQDRLRARMVAAAAAVTASEARVRMRALELDFTTVRAPISGRVSSRRVDPGNQVIGGEGTNGTLLTTINALDPIYFSFDASEALFLKAKRDMTGDGSATRVDVRLQDEADYRWHGRLDFTDNGLNPRSGTIKMRATLANPDLFLTPGMFGNMRLAAGGKAMALLVPDTAVQTDQARKILLVVGKNDVVSAKPVQLGPVVEGMRIIRSGLSATDKVIVGGIQAATPGNKVQAKPSRISPLVTTQQPDAPLFGGEATFAK